MPTFMLDGEPYIIRVPSEANFEVCKTSHYKFEFPHHMLLSDNNIQTGYCSAMNKDSKSVFYFPMGAENKNLGFRPFLTFGYGLPVPDSISAQNGTVKKAFTMLVDGNPVRIPQNKQDKSEQWRALATGKHGMISFTDEFFGSEYLIPWVFFGGIAFSIPVLLTDISWDTLQQQGYI